MNATAAAHRIAPPAEGVVTHWDVIVIGAGISGISSAYHLKKYCPDKSFIILESRKQLGGTWDLFRYPGVRSDSDMLTLGFSFKPWMDAKTIADGDRIRAYLEETTQEYAIAEKIRYGCRVRRASWRSDAARWCVEAERGADGQQEKLSCNFLHICAGYYNYDEGYSPVFKGAESFWGRIVHPQHWPQDLDYDDQLVVVIGSGATAVTLVPAMAERAAHVTMLQRSPSYIVSLPAEDRAGNFFRNWLPGRIGWWLVRWRNILYQMMIFRRARRQPEKFKQAILNKAQKELGSDYDVATHLTPDYDPWTQRLCLVPDADLFEAIREGKAEIVTDHIDTFTKQGIRLKSGKELEADLIITATGLKLQFLGGVEVIVDGISVVPGKTLTYKGMMVSDVPNLVFSMGYINASWTLRADLTCAYVCRLLNHMARHKHISCVPRYQDPGGDTDPYLDFSSGYIQRSLHEMPRQGRRKPWRLDQNYLVDMRSLRFGRVDDGVMEFTAK